MGRPKRYPTPAARQAAYRQRREAETVRVNRKSLRQLEARVDDLQTAIAQAKAAGYPLACSVCHASVDTTLEALTTWFRTASTEALSLREKIKKSQTS